MTSDSLSLPPLPADFAARFWRKDSGLWGETHAESAGQFLGWIDIAQSTLRQADEVDQFVRQALGDGIQQAVVLGMGGSSLSALMLADGFTTHSGLELHVLDSTVPGDVLRIRRQVDLARTLFIVASKSGTTIEPLSFEEYFYDQLQRELPGEGAKRMVAITDPGSEMEARARERGYRHIFKGEPTVGGRFSIFSVFGMVPAALLGLDFRAMLQQVIDSSGADDHPGFELGQWMAACLHNRRDKLTFITSTGFDSVGLWAEQLIAESTGKNGKGMLPIATEPTGDPREYGEDRAFFVISHPDRSASIATQVPPGVPTQTRTVADPVQLAALLFELEIATATLGALLEVNPFDQPNVQAAKDIARAELNNIQESGETRRPEADITDGLLFLSGTSGSNVAEAIDSFVGDTNRICATVLAFLPESAPTTEAIQQIRVALRSRHRCATAFGYGPRYLHSTGQYHKGGTNNGRFIIVTAEPAQDIPIPGMNATFGQLMRAQAMGDLGALRQNGRAVLHLHIASTDPAPILDKLARQIRGLAPRPSD